jgi:hypothetical protein
MLLLPQAAVRSPRRPRNERDLSLKLLHGADPHWVLDYLRVTTSWPTAGSASFMAVSINRARLSVFVS